MITPQAYIVIQKDDGSTSVYAFVIQGMSPTLPFGAAWLNDGSGQWMRPPTEANIMEEFSRAFPKLDQLGVPIPQPVSWKIVDVTDIPTDRTFRGAWVHDGEKFDHDMDKARQIHLTRIRHDRTEYLGKLDRDWNRAHGQGKTAEAQQIEDERQRMRDVPTTIPLDQATTVEELKGMWPTGLPRLK